MTEFKKAFMTPAKVWRFLYMTSEMKSETNTNRMIRCMC